VGLVVLLEAEAESQRALQPDLMLVPENFGAPGIETPMLLEETMRLG
jgi:hypothetical protein